MAAASNIILREGLRDRSFAGPFAYVQNTPQKVFAGNEPYVPLPTMVHALDALQQGKGPGDPYAAGMQKAAAGHLSQCHRECLQSHQCDPKDQHCMKQVHQCAQQCTSD